MTICREKRLSVAFLGMDAGHLLSLRACSTQTSRLELEPKEFDGGRRKWLGEWRPEALLVIDRWDGVIRKEGHFDVKLRSFLKERMPTGLSRHSRVPGPCLNVRDEINLREFVIWRMGMRRRCPV